MRGGEVEAPLWGRGFEVPEPDGVVEGAGEEVVGGGADGEGGDVPGVAFEVAEELVVVGGEVADFVVELGAGIDDGGGVVGEAGEVGAVLLGEQLFHVPAFFGVVELDGAVVAGSQQELAGVVEIE